MTAPNVAQLTEEERVSIKHHLGYAGVDEMQTFVLGVPAAIETQFIIEGAMNRVRISALPKLRQLLVVLDTIEAQMVEDLELLAVNRLDTIEVNQGEQKALENRYDYWVNALGNVLGATRNPFDARKYNRQGGINAGVQG